MRSRMTLRGFFVLALVAAICFALGAFGVTVAGHALLLPGLFFLALHFVLPVAAPVWRR